MSNSNAPVILRRRDVQAKTGLSRSTIYALMNAKTNPFPKPIHMSPRTVGWLEDDINAYIQDRINDSGRAMKEGA